VRATECGKEIVEHFLVRQIRPGQAPDQAYLLTAQQVIGSHTKA
jgi:hypothetical protein